MRYIVSITLVLTMFLAMGTFMSVSAADISVRLDEPTSPTKIRDFNLGFVASDILGRSVSVKCYKKAPSDGAFSQFDTTKTYSGSGSGNCSITSSITSSDGTYQFYVEAVAGGDTENSQVVAVDINTSGPGTPISYSKDKTASCEYTIKFTTADDAGKTTYVEVYRSDSTTIGLDAGSRVGTVSAGSNEEKVFTNTVPDCGKTYYYVIRAFDTAGNGSGSIGDTVVKTVTTSTVTVNQSSEAGNATTEGTIETSGASTAEVGAIPINEEESFVQDEDQQVDEEEVDEKNTDQDIENEISDESTQEVLGAQDENKPFFLIAWFLAIIEWIKNLFQ